MFGGASVLARMPIWRAIAAKGHTAGLTGAQMQPGPADFDALGAFAGFGMFHVSDRVQMSTHFVISYQLSVISYRS